MWRPNGPPILIEQTKKEFSFERGFQTKGRSKSMCWVHDSDHAIVRVKKKCCTRMPKASPSRPWLTKQSQDWFYKRCRKLAGAVHIISIYLSIYIYTHNIYIYAHTIYIYIISLLHFLFHCTIRRWVISYAANSSLSEGPFYFSNIGH